MSDFVSSFNARYSTPEQIAATFVPPDQLRTIATFANLILVGPRGIGKTTILKVLTSSGLFHLSKRMDISDLKIDYLPVYIPAEKMWKGNAEAIANAGFSPEKQDEILDGLFVNHCLYHLVASVREAARIGEMFSGDDCPPWALKLSAAQEEAIARMASDLWSLEKIQTSFVGLKISLIKRTNDFCTAVNSVEMSPSNKSLADQPRLNILKMLQGFFDIVEDVYQSLRWSINFDEMEIAPDRLVRELFENLRSFDQRAVLKLSMFPYVEFYRWMKNPAPDSESPGPGNDFVSVNLANRFTHSTTDFSRDLVLSICKARKVDFEDFRNFLNSSSAIIPGTRLFKETGLRRNHAAILERVIADRSDPSFLSYLKEKGVQGSDDIGNLPESKRASFIRKTFPIAELRMYYLREKPTVEDGVMRRSIKGYGYYHGFEQVLTLTEGNPRAVQFYVSELIDAFAAGERASTAQNAAIGRNVNRFRAFVATQAVPHTTAQRSLHNTLNVVDRLGADLANFLFSSDFKPEPPLSFYFKDLDSTTREIIGIAINTGAIVPDQPTEAKDLIFDLLGYRLRVSYRLAPYYPLPTITGQSKPLRRIPSAKNEVDEQPDLLTYRFEND
jgi:hypothetical protein